MDSAGKVTPFATDAAVVAPVTMLESGPTATEGAE
jgi:hypothetical protein